ncbi:uncharacterized protein FOMMEDRAFT_158208 [Fomitiporia mediterranea MF3/22]|uniref:uncharacterized protein n=1 Tax=Fomitiporia mediterranea (strain MF3/22) TaxID=694068 RepID=UPI00044097B9|nr:uncharacterized protein FOMMEDRAFT_158208 [Fomitiporia mediterranea MF3/22]EJD01074.1 hypothetical protein FOMMEDRAFT_158208 [Fomitiporia mediterranea MF3/22]
MYIVFHWCYEAHAPVIGAGTREERVKASRSFAVIDVNDRRVIRAHVTDPRFHAHFTHSSVIQPDFAPSPEPI